MSFPAAIDVQYFRQTPVEINAVGQASMVARDDEGEEPPDFGAIETEGFSRPSCRMIRTPLGFASIFFGDIRLELRGRLSDVVQEPSQAAGLRPTENLSEARACLTNLSKMFGQSFPIGKGPRRE